MSDVCAAERAGQNAVMRAVLVAVVCVLVVGCGGDSRLSQAEFEAQANEICTELERAFDAMGEAETPAELESQLERSERELTAAIAELRELEPPEESEAGYARFLAAADSLAALIRDLRDAATANDVARLEQIAARGDAISARAEKAATSIGLDDCAESGRG